jgi:hypothetical protein
LNVSADSGEININLQKVEKGSTWDGALQGQGQSVDPMTKESMQKKIMLERFQEEVYITIYTLTAVKTSTVCFLWLTSNRDEFARYQPGQLTP